MKKFLLVALSAKFTHSSLALKYLTKFNHNDTDHHLTALEFTINQSSDYIVGELFCRKPDVLFFSTYIWNIEQINEMASILKKILPDCCIVLGGPEVSYDSETFLTNHLDIDMILRGEGEIIFSNVLDYFDGFIADISTISGITYRNQGQIISTTDQAPLDLSLLPFPYEENFADVTDKIIYYESSRGCPYQCGYCLSSIEKGVRFVPLEQVYFALQKFLDAKVRQVKFIDRTFNCNKIHTMCIWQYIHLHDNGVTNFHFEITGDILDDDMLSFLKTVRKGLFQFEIGVQSTNPKTIAAINRNVDFNKLATKVQQIKAGGNIHQHLDLIAGLPYEDYTSFQQSFNAVYQLKPEQLQLGFLKVLKGSMIFHRKEDFGIGYHPAAPYEVLFTNDLPYEDTLRLKYIEEMVEQYYNSSKFTYTIDYIVPFYPDPFTFYEQLSHLWLDQGYHHKPHSKMGLCDILFQFVQQNAAIDPKQFQWRLKFDLCLHDKPKKIPSWCTSSVTEEEKQQIIAFYRNQANIACYLPNHVEMDSKQIAKQTHIELLGDTQRQAILFDYSQRDILNNARFTLISLS